MTTLPEGSILVKKSRIVSPELNTDIHFYQHYCDFYVAIFKPDSTEIDAIRKVWRSKDGWRNRFSYKGNTYVGGCVPAERMW